MVTNHVVNLKKKIAITERIWIIFIQQDLQSLNKSPYSAKWIDALDLGSFVQFARIRILVYPIILFGTEVSGVTL